MLAKVVHFLLAAAAHLCVGFYQGATEPCTIVNDQADGTPEHISTGAEMHTIPKNRTENVLV